MGKIKKVLALVIAMVMIASTIGAFTAFADETSKHTITIQNTDQNVSHSYEAYQVFVGKLDDQQQKLSDIQWGSGVDGSAVLTALKGDSTYGTYFANCNSAADVAEALAQEPFTSTDGADVAAGATDAIAAIIGEHLSTTKVSFEESNKTYTATVTGDGYYFIKDTTTTLTSETGSDTKSKFMLSVIKDTTIVAKDTHLTPDKEIVVGEARVKQGTAAVGDTVTFEVKIPVPNTKKYVDHFVFDMKDTLPAGMTFMSISSIKVENADVPYTLTVAPSGTDNYAAYTEPADAAAAVTTAGGQKLKVVFNNFKANAEAGNWIGKDLVVTYTAVVNDKADFTPTGNENEVYFDYANDPNHDYDGDEPGPDEPMGETPHDKTKTLLINLEVMKTGDNGTTAALEGAEFEITSSEYNVTLVSGEKYEANGYTAKAGETIAQGTYYKLKDGSYTTTAPSNNSTMYEEGTFVKVTFVNANTTPGSANKVTAITGTDGKIVLNGLKPGTYSVRETKAPTGYNLDPNTYTIKINWSYNAGTKTGTFSRDDSSTEGFSWDGENATAKVTIDDKSGTELPSTGGMGTTIFYVIGGLLVLAAAIVLISRKRVQQ